MGSSLKNIARNGKSYLENKHKIFSHVKTNTTNVSEETLTDFLKKSLLSLDKKEWKLLPLDDKDKKNLQYFETSKDENFTKLYLEFLKDYILINANLISDLETKRRSVETSLFNGDPIKDSIDEFSEQEKQSLFFLKLFCAENIDDQESLVNYITGNPYSYYIRGIFRDPLIAYFAYTPELEDLDNVLSYTLPNYDEKVEIEISKSLLDFNYMVSKNLNFACYLCLTMHPYDAYEYILEYVEAKFSKNGVIDNNLLKICKNLNNTCPTAKSEILLNVLKGGLKTEEGGNEKYLIFDYIEVDKQVESFFSDFITPDTQLPIKAREEYSYQRLLANMRNDKYPDENSWHDLFKLQKKFYFTHFGSLLNRLARSLYLYPRKKDIAEYADVIKLASYTGYYNNYILKSPRGRSFIQRILKDQELLESYDKSSERNLSNRLWLPNLHLDLSILEQDNNLSVWLDLVRNNIGVETHYLTGIDWDWVDNFISKLGIVPFQNADGIYC